MTNDEYHDTLVRIACEAEIAIKSIDEKGVVMPWTMNSLRKDVSAWINEMHIRTKSIKMKGKKYANVDKI